MPDLTLTTAIGTYGHTRALKDSTTTSDRFSMEHVEISPIPMIFRRMVRGLEFDVAEMALATYFCARAHHKEFTALPIFLTRDFYHGATVVLANSGIEKPADLAGKKVGVRSYTLTPGIWTRALLQNEYGLDLDSVTWVLSGDEHVAEYQAPSNVVSGSDSDLIKMLRSGEIDAAIGVGAVDSADIQPLIPDADAAISDWFNKTGIYPISHILVVKNSQLEDHSWLTEELYSLFGTAKKDYVRLLNAGDSLTPADQTQLKMSRIVGGDPLPYGLEGARQTLETFMQYNVEQQIVPQYVDPEGLFATV